jgi:periplasmic protein TonB
LPLRDANPLARIASFNDAEALTPAMGEQTMIATLNAFPPLHTFNSSRSWFLAVIVLLHLGFLWALNSGLTVGDIIQRLPPMVVVTTTPVKPVPVKPIPIKPIEGVIKDTVTIVELDKPTAVIEEEQVITGTPTDLTQVVQEQEEGPGSAVPAIVEPRIDPRLGLSEPVYPVAEIRLGHEGTVLLAVQVRPNGRVGAVKLERSSGYPRLDESALREARTWRMIPGTRDGATVEMWKLVPITFRLKN